MDAQSLIYENFRCRKCQRRLEKPLELRCKHPICRSCLETIIRNHRSNARCPTCNQYLNDYNIENYTYLPADHMISRLLSTFIDVNQCETCQSFTIVKKCSKCAKDQCDSCYSKHEETHKQIPIESSTKINNSFSKEEFELIEKMKNFLNEKEYEDFIQVAHFHLDDAIRKECSTNEKPPSFLTPTEIYDWSKHVNLTADDIINSTSERVKQLLRVDFKPRPYQIRMARAGLKGENSLICLQTGAGKTFIAGIIAKYLYIVSLRRINNSFISSSSLSRQFKAVFLVPIKALVDQQCSAFKKVFIDQPDSILKPIDNQVGERFPNIYEQFNIFFFTAQKFVNFLEEKHTDLANFDLIMIDECHHCYENHPINSLMRRYHRLKSRGSTVPQIISLTASVGTNKKNAFQHLVHLCANLDCFDICAITRGAEEEELRNSTNTPLADTILPVPKLENDPVVEILKENIMKSIANRLGLQISSMDNQKLENYLVQMHNTSCSANDHDMIIGTDYLRNLNRFLIFYGDLPLNKCMEWLEEILQGTSASQPTQFDKFCLKQLDDFRLFVSKILSNSEPIKPKLKRLVELIENLHSPGCRGLILVRTKFHTVALEDFLNENPAIKRRNIVVGHLTGQGSADDLSLPGNQQATILNEFREGKKTLLVATDVAQEGLDVAECSYVIRYEFVSNEIGTVQSRGRARAAQSKCYLITESSSINHQHELENRVREDEMRQAIDEWREKGIVEFKKLVEQEQTQILVETDKNDSKSNSVQTSKKPAHEVNCRFCDQYLCNGSSLRSQGTTIVCTDPQFERLINSPKTAGEKFFCPNTECHRELGGVILLSRNKPAYSLNITSLKFRFADGAQPTIYKKWSLYLGYIQSL